ncbi:hypothetical protein D0B54_22610 [Solimonas sp. K1W22B-7]|uniref:OmpP1/FadL family transporter n=1 Tax=Solimonas sp. K1W22B-7 TaxID=2303331 RepID=UPI000E333837|nr:outer membrane protein transport protein [Solimonas sp. K1W22B-7]AXQ31302.1 hypothetical protein D0B54_22610 [Solimonas sp. K1W22B-7]
MFGESTSRHPRWRRFAALAALTLPLPAIATNGYFAHGYSASQRAMGGAGTALTEDALISTINPAGLVWVGNRVDVNISVFSPVRDYTSYARGEDANIGIIAIDPATVKSDNDLFYIPGFAYSRRIDDFSSWGIAVYGNGGMNTEYQGNTAQFGQGFGLGPLTFATQCGGTFGGGAPVAGAADPIGFCGNARGAASVNLIQLFIVPTYSFKIGERSSIGISPLLAGQRFRADGLQAFAPFSNAPDKVTDNGYDRSYGYGGRVGVLTGVIPGVGIGASYQTRVRMTELKDYAGLFAEEGDFDIPSTWNVGLSFHPSENLRLAVDYQRINFSEVASVGNPLDPNRFVNDCALPRLLNGIIPIVGSDAPSSACLGAANGPGFGWEDVQVYKFGAQYKFAAFKFRAGYSFARSQPIPENEVLFNILAPAVVEKHFTAGLSYQYSKAVGFDLAAMYAPDNPVRGKNPLSNVEANLVQILAGGAAGGSPALENAFDADPQDQDISIDMHQWEITLGFNYRF